MNTRRSNFFSHQSNQKVLMKVVTYKNYILLEKEKLNK